MSSESRERNARIKSMGGIRTMFVFAGREMEVYHEDWGKAMEYATHVLKEWPRSVNQVRIGDFILTRG